VRALIKITKLDSALDELISIDDTLKIVDNNRTRIRTLAGIMLTVCGLLLSTSFVVLTFILRNSDIRISRFVPIFLFATSGLLTGSIIFIVLSARLPKPVALISKIELLDLWTRIYQREYRWVTVAVSFLIAAILLFITALGVLGVNVIK
jgi:hypothetical protein